MYYATIDDEVFFRTDIDVDELTLTSCTLKKVAGQSGEMKFTIPPCNIAYSDEKLKKLKSRVRLYRNNETNPLFSARIYSLKKDFNNNISVVCEGLKSLLNDGIIRPFTYNGTLNGLIQQLLDKHYETTQVLINLGNITVTDANDYIYRKYEVHDTTIARLDALVESYGGYMNIVERNNQLYLDWIAEFTDVNAQHIDFGENLLNITIEENSDEIITALIPLGSRITKDDVETSERITIKDVNAGNDYILASDEYITKYGYIWGCMTWNDVNLDTNLLSKARAELNRRLANNVTIKITSVDLANCGQTIDSYDTEKKVVIDSAAHGLSSVSADVLQLSLNCIDASSDRMIVSTIKRGYISANNTAVKNEITEFVTIGNSNIASNILDKLDSATSELYGSVITAQTQIESNKGDINALLSQIQTLSGQIREQSLKIAANAENFGFYFGTNGKITSWFNFDSTGYFTIGKDGNKIRSRQDNDSYEFIDQSDNVLLKIVPEGVYSQTLASNQIKIYSGNPEDCVDQWAIRLGAQSNGKNNLDIMWIGG